MKEIELEEEKIDEEKKNQRRRNRRRWKTLIMLEGVREDWSGILRNKRENRSKIREQEKKSDE